MEESGQIKISVHQGPYETVGGRPVRIGKWVTIKRPGRAPRTYQNPSLDSFVALTDLIQRHALPIYPWATMLGYTVYWDPDKGEVESGDESGVPDGAED